MPPPVSPPVTPARPAPRPSGRFADRFGRSTGVQRKAFKLGLYGPGGVGKSTLMGACPGILIADTEFSTQDLDVNRVTGIESMSPDGTVDGAASWLNLRAWMQSTNDKIVGIDSMTRAEDWCAAYVIKTKSSNEGARAKDSLEDFKYKAGLTFVCDEFKRFLADIDGAFLRGVSVVMIAHNRVSKYKNPDGSDYVRTEPRLLHDDKGSNMLPWVELVDHLLYIDLDTSVNKGKASGGGSRTLYFANQPNRIAKTRYLAEEPLELVRGEAKLWEMLGCKA